MRNACCLKYLNGAALMLRKFFCAACLILCLGACNTPNPGAPQGYDGPDAPTDLPPPTDLLGESPQQG